MLLKITNVCHMGCIHCLDNCKPEGVYMSLEQIDKNIEFIKKLQSKVIIVSGGEPTEHPYFFEIVEQIKKHFNKRAILIASNGMFLFDEKKRYRIQKLDVSVQITNDKRYYPKEIPFIKHKNFIYETHIRTLKPQGRAKTLCCTKTSPDCYNLRSLVIHNELNLKSAINLLELKGYFCKPVINANGTISIGESVECTTIGKLGDTIETLEKNIRAMRCNNCGLMNQLSSMHLDAIHMNNK